MPQSGWVFHREIAKRNSSKGRGEGRTARTRDGCKKKGVERPHKGQTSRKQKANERKKVVLILVINMLRQPNGRKKQKKGPPK